MENFTPIASLIGGILIGLSVSALRFTGDGKNAQMISMGDEKFSNPPSVFDGIPPIGSRKVQNE